MAHRRQAPDVVHDNLRGRYFRTAREQQKAFEDEVAADPNVQRGVTITRKSDWTNPHAKIQNPTTIRLAFEQEPES